VTNRTLDYVPRLDDRNHAYRITARPGLENQARYWTPGSAVLDQGQEGSCVGHGVVGEYMASPVRGLPGAGAWTGHLKAVEVYNRAKEIDEWEGVDYDGTSVRAGMLVGRERGWWSGFQWAMNMAELRAALEAGPVVIGVEWREEMDQAPGGRVTVGGPAVGGHCLVITGYCPRYRPLRGPAYRWRNSWGTGYGVRGSAYIRPADLESILFGSGGEAAVATGRAVEP
jgi:hypothetical protein